jgi:hypothetical protein
MRIRLQLLDRSDDYVKIVDCCQTPPTVHSCSLARLICDESLAAWRFCYRRWAACSSRMPSVIGQTVHLLAIKLILALHVARLRIAVMIPAITNMGLRLRGPVRKHTAHIKTICRVITVAGAAGRWTPSRLLLMRPMAPRGC